MFMTSVTEIVVAIPKDCLISVVKLYLKFLKNYKIFRVTQTKVEEQNKFTHLQRIYK